MFSKYFQNCFHFRTLLLLGLLFPAFQVEGTNYYVNDNNTTGDIFTSAIGNNGNSGASAASPKATLTAIWNTYGPAGTNAISAGDTIYIDAGTYIETDRDISITVGITIKGAGMDVTVFDNNNSGTTGYGFIRLNASNISLVDFTIHEYGRDNTYAHAIDIGSNYTGLEVNNIEVSNCGRTTGQYPIEVASGAQVNFNGGGSVCNGSWIMAGGIRIAGATTIVNINEYSFIGNERNQDGVALNIDNSTVTIRNSLFKNNILDVDNEGAAVYSAGASANVKIYDSQVEANGGSQSAGGVYGNAISVAGGQFLITRSKIIDNILMGCCGSSAPYGGGIGVTSGTTTVDSCYFSGNSGGSTRGHDIYVHAGTLNAFNCTFATGGSNRIGCRAGGSFSIDKCASPSISGGYNSVTTINNNSPTYVSSPAVPAYTGTCPDLTIITLCNGPVISGTTTICSGNSTSLSASGGSPYNWYSAASGGVPFYTGTSYTTSLLTADTTFYVTSGTCTTRTSVEVNVNLSDDASFSYSSGTFCDVGTATPTITGLNGGTFSAGAGLVFIDVITGEIDLVSSTPGNYTITYTTNGSCPDSSNVDLTITTNPADPTFSYSSGNFCKGSGTEAPIFTTGSAGTFDASPIGLSINSSGVIDLVNSQVGTYTITNTISGGGCAPVFHDETVVIDSDANVDAGSTGSVCEGDSYNLSGTFGGAASSITWSSVTGGTFDDPASVNAQYSPSATDISNGNFTITITTNDPAGTCVAATDNVTITLNAAPQAPSFSLASAVICEGMTTSVSVNNPVAGVTYNIYDALSGGNLLGTSPMNVSPVTDSFFYVEAVSSAGCIQLSARVQFDITVNPAPLAPSLTENSVTICEGENTTLAVSSPAAGVTYNVYDAITNGNEIGVAPLILSPIASSNYFVEAVSDQGCSQLTARVQYSVTVNPAPSEPVLTNTSEVICEGETATISVSNPEVGITYNIYDAATNGNILGQAPMVISPVSDSLFYIEAVSDQGCLQLTGRVSYTIAVNPAPNAPVLSSNSESICEGQSTILQINNPLGGVTYNVYDAATNGTLIGAAPIIVTPTTNSSYFVEAVSDQGCVQLEARIQFDVVVNPIPSSPILSEDTAYCQGNISDMIAIGSGIITWYSDAGLTNVIGVGSPFTPSNTIGTTTYFVAQTSSGCESNSSSINITITPSPVAPVITSNPESYCQGETIEALEAFGSVMGSTFIWYADAALTDSLGSGNFIPSNTVGTNTYYVVEVSGNCKSNADSVTVTITPSPLANFSYTPNGGEAPLNVEFTDLTTDESGTLVSLNWDLSGLFSSSDSAFSYSISDSGQYNVTLIATNALECSDTISYIIDISLPFSLEIPNVFTPNNDNTNDIFNVKSNNLKTLKGQIYNRWGEFIYEWETLKGGWDGTSMKGVKVPDGTYFYIISAVDGNENDYHFQGHLTLIR